MGNDFFITFLDCDNVQMQYTVEVSLPDGSTVDTAEGFFKAQMPSTKRALILSIFDCDTIEELYKNDMAIPPEIARYLGDEENCEGIRFDGEGTLIPEVNSDEPTGGFPFGIDPFDSGKTDQSNGNDDDYEDGDEWKRLLH